MTAGCCCILASAERVLSCCSLFTRGYIFAAQPLYREKTAGTCGRVNNQRLLLQSNWHSFNTCHTPLGFCLANRCCIKDLLMKCYLLGIFTSPQQNIVFSSGTVKVHLAVLIFLWSTQNVRGLSWGHVLLRWIFPWQVLIEALQQTPTVQFGS